MVKEYIERSVLREIYLSSKRENTHHTQEARRIHQQEHIHILDLLDKAPAADVVEVDMVAEMLYRALGDSCPCNFNGIDEWLPEVCDLLKECPCPQGEFACWKQFIKHYGERKDSADNAAD